MMAKAAARNGLDVAEPHPYIPIGMEQMLAPPPPKGRPREFCTEKALAAALRVFWLNGYESASMAELTAAMGITKPSLYAAFGNKEQLFHKALDLYEQEKLAYTKSALSAPTARGVAERLLKGALEMQTNSGDPKGCLAVMSVVSCGAEAESIRNDVIQRRASSGAALVARFQEAKDAGEFPEALEPEALVQFLYAIMQGLAVQAGAGTSCADLCKVVETSMAVWPTK
jgi:AcrR family transcriptional regulator